MEEVLGTQRLSIFAGSWVLEVLLGYPLLHSSALAQAFRSGKAVRQVAMFELLVFQGEPHT